MYDYTDAFEQAREAQRQVQPPVPGFPVPQAPEGGPLGGIQDQVAGVLNSADSHHIYLPGPGGALLQYPRGRQPSIARDMAYGAVAGFGAWVVWRRMQRRRQAKGEFTSPGFRGLALLLGFPVIGFALSMEWIMETGWLFGGGCVLGVVFFIVYAVYRASGHGKYNSKRQGSPWRDGHHRIGR